LLEFAIGAVSAKGGAPAKALFSNGIDIVASGLYSLAGGLLEVTTFSTIAQ
jgi:hypothetical protein